MRHLCAVLVVALGAASCGWETDGLARLESLYPTPQPRDAGPSGPVDIGTPACNGLDGDWAVRLVQKGTITPLLEPWDITLNDLFLARRSADGTAMELRFCDQAVDILASGQPSTMGQTEMPAALKTALFQAPLSVPLPGDGSFEASEVVWLWGLSGLDDVKNGALPDKSNYASSPYVIDEDSDGKPGVTVHVLSPLGDRHMVRRAVLSFAHGKLSLNNQWLTGTLASRIDESALSATSALLMTPAPITIDPAATVYQLRCVGPTFSCDALAAQHAAVFQDAPR